MQNFKATQKGKQLNLSLTEKHTAKTKAEGSHRARWGDPRDVDFSIGITGVAGEGESLTSGQNHSCGWLELNYRRRSGYCNKTNLM